MLHRPPIEAVFSREGVRALDRAAAEELGIPSLMLMENAAWAIVEAAEEMLGGSSGAPARGTGPRDGVLVFCGPGSNGGDGLAAARKLHNLGRHVRIILAARRDAIRGDALTNLVIAERMGLTVTVVDPDADPSSRPRGRFDAEAIAAGARPALVLDALLGTGQTRPVGPPMDDVVRGINALRDSGAPVLAVDIPTGLDADTGEPLGEASLTVRATRTITLAGLKKGFLNPASRAYTGGVAVGEIGVPAPLLRRFAERTSETARRGA